MSKLFEFGRKALFYVRLLSGYEERRLRTLKSQLQKRVVEVEAKKAALKKIPEQVILTEVRRMVEGMQALNQKLEETETAIGEYFKPIDNQVDKIMKAKQKGEEEKMKRMLDVVKEQALLQKEEEDRIAAMSSVSTNQQQKKSTED